MAVGLKDLRVKGSEDQRRIQFHVCDLLVLFLVFMLQRTFWGNNRVVGKIKKQRSSFES